MEDVTVAAVNFRPEFGQIDLNLARLERWVEQLAGQGAEIICFPEMSICGYDHTPAVYPLAQPVPGPATERLVTMAARYQVTILAGLAELPPAGQASDGRLYITHVVATPQGLAGIYRKTHVGPSERDMFQPGHEVSVFQPGHCCFGLQLCYDAHYPEMSTLQALAGADILFMASASPRDDPPQKKERMLRYLPARAYDNSCYVVACNLVGPGQAGQSFAGVALIINPKGEILAEAVSWEEDAAMCRLNGSEVERIRRTKMGYFLAHRRPELYRSGLREEQ